MFVKLKMSFKDENYSNTIKDKYEDKYEDKLFLLVSIFCFNILLFLNYCNTIFIIYILKKTI